MVSVKILVLTLIVRDASFDFWEGWVELPLILVMEIGKRLNVTPL